MISNAIYEVYRVWEWLDRLEANDLKVPIQKVGVLQILGIQNISNLRELEDKLDTSFTSNHVDVGAAFYYSRSRALIKKSCGWVNSLGLENNKLSICKIKSYE